jgi:peptide/nickel transport system permease protein
LHFPLDLLLSRITEVFASLPRLVLILTLSALARPSLLNLILIFGLTGWTDIARIVRAEMLKIRTSDYLQVAIGQGFPAWRIILVHALPNIIQPALVSILFGVSGVILAESALSFLGIGVPFDTVTWGSLIAAGRENFNAWWLVVFPGLAIFFTIWSLNVFADEIHRKI